MVETTRRTAEAGTGPAQVALIEDRAGGRNPGRARPPRRRAPSARLAQMQATAIVELAEAATRRRGSPKPGTARAQRRPSTRCRRTRAQA
ncbi:hypothetical protein ACU4GD_19715 [Cupriavidus basilensis]